MTEPGLEARGQDPSWEVRTASGSGTLEEAQRLPVTGSTPVAALSYTHDLVPAPESLGVARARKDLLM